MKTGKEYLLEQLKGFENHDDYKPENIEAMSAFMESYAKYYHQEQGKLFDLADVGETLQGKKFQILNDALTEIVNWSEEDAEWEQPSDLAIDALKRMNEVG